MARLLTEFSVKGLLALLQSKLNTELGYIASERGDGKALPAVAAWACWNQDAAVPQAPLCTVDLVGGSVFPRMVAEVVQARPGSRMRLSHRATLGVSVVFPARANETPGLLKERGMRYGAAIARVVADNPDLAITGGTASVAATVASLPVVYVLPGEDRRTARTQLNVEVDVTESPAGETQAGQGAPPSAVIE